MLFKRHTLTASNISSVTEWPLRSLKATVLEPRVSAAFQSASKSVAQKSTKLLKHVSAATVGLLWLCNHSWVLFAVS